jgi:hypothetical protein
VRFHGGAIGSSLGFNLPPLKFNFAKLEELEKKLDSQIFWNHQIDGTFVSRQTNTKKIFFAFLCQHLSSNALPPCPLQVGKT